MLRHAHGPIAATRRSRHTNHRRHTSQTAKLKKFASEYGLSLDTCGRLWLRQCAKMTFSSDPDAQQISAQLFSDAADSAEFTAINPGLPRPPGNGLFPLSQDFQ